MLTGRRATTPLSGGSRLSTRRTAVPADAGSRERILAAALGLITRRGNASVTMADIARASRLSRQAVYLHFADRGALLVALVQYADDQRGLAADIARIAAAPTGAAAMAEMVAVHARSNPAIWAVARAVDAARRTDRAAEQSWQDRMARRLAGCRQIVARLKADGSLRPGLSPGAAADLLWSLTSLRAWEELVLERGWSPVQYAAALNRILRVALLRKPR